MMIMSWWRGWWFSDGDEMEAMVVGVAFGGDVAAGSGSRGGGDDEDGGCGVDRVDRSRVVMYGVGGGSPEVA
ncbi:hypothetical protein Tco_1393713 [Tanacetum coccineum]